MAEDKHESGKRPAARSAGGPALLGSLAAVGTLLAVGIGIGVYLVSPLIASLRPDGAASVGSAAAVAPAEGGAILAEAHEIVLPDLTSNIKSQQGRRYIKVSPAIWIATADARQMGLLGGGEGGRGAGNEVKRMLQMSLEEHLKRYDLEEFTGPNIYDQLKQGFQQQVEKTLHDLFPSYPPDHRFVKRVVLTNLLAQ
jgi:hypothetical protein